MILQEAIDRYVAWRQAHGANFATSARVLHHFSRNRKRMDYAGAAQRGLPIGSGVVEAACKTLVTERMKRSGMRAGVRTVAKRS